jgi:hypothetical protein
MPDEINTDVLSEAPWHAKRFSAEKPAVTVNQDKVIIRQGKQFVLYAGLLDAAHRAGMTSIYTSLVQAPSSTNGGVCICHATAEFPWGSYTGIGDADDQNVSRNIAPHKIRMAETRAKARALRDALNVGMAAIEELSGLPDDDDKPASTHVDTPTTNGNRQSTPAAGGGAAPRRAPVPPPDREATPPPSGPPTPRRAALDKLTRIQGTATRLGIKSDLLQPVTEDAEADDIEAIYQRLLPLVNQALSPKSGQSK